MVRESPDEAPVSGGDRHPPPDPHRRRHRSHHAILDAVMAQLETLGYQHMTIEGVAAQAGVGKATVYRWWSSKAQLVVEALSNRCHLEPAAVTGDLRADVRGVVEHVVGVISKTPLGRILPHLLVDLEHDSPARRKLQEWLGPARARNRGLLYAAAGRAELPHDIDATLLLDLLGGAVLWRTLLGRKPDARLVDQLTDLVVNCALPRANPLEGTPCRPESPR